MDLSVLINRLLEKRGRGRGKSIEKIKIKILIKILIIRDLKPHKDESFRKMQFLQNLQLSAISLVLGHCNPE